MGNSNHFLREREGEVCGLNDWGAGKVFWKEKKKKLSEIPTVQISELNRLIIYLAPRQLPEFLFGCSLLTSTCNLIINLICFLWRILEISSKLASCKICLESCLFVIRKELLADCTFHTHSGCRLNCALCLASAHFAYLPLIDVFINLLHCMRAQWKLVSLAQILKFDATLLSSLTSSLLAARSVKKDHTVSVQP